MRVRSAVIGPKPMTATPSANANCVGRLCVGTPKRGVIEEGWALGSGQVLLRPPAQIPAPQEGREAQEATGTRDSPIVG